MDSHDKNANSRCRVGSLLNPPPLEMVFGEVHKGCIDELIIDGEFNPSGFNPPYDLRLIYFLLRINYFTISLTVFSRSAYHSGKTITLNKGQKHIQNETPKWASRGLLFPDGDAYSNTIFPVLMSSITITNWYSASSKPALS
jgi:hypothetical protein